MKLDFSEVKETVEITDGKHEVTIVKAEEKVSKNGTPMLNLSMKELETDAFISDNVCLAGAGAFKCKQLLDALGLSEDEFKAMSAADLTGMEVGIIVEHREYEDTLRASVKRYTSL